MSPYQQNLDVEALQRRWRRREEMRGLLAGLVWGIAAGLVLLLAGVAVTP